MKYQNNLKKILKQKKMSTAEFHRQLEVFGLKRKKSTFYRWTANESQPDLDLIPYILKFLKLRFDDVFFIVSNENKE
jgi:transcriptional regulator with XRE-family HTH domain